MQTETLGFIGLGTMGQPMAANLLARGFPLVVYDVNPAALEPARAQGARAVGSPRGLRMLDAPVSGAPPKARDGTLTIMVGGDAEVLDACRPILEALGEHIFHVGPLGTGEAVKLVNNLLAASHAAALGEALNIGVRFGLSPRVLYDVISTSSGDCWSLRTRVPYPDVLAASPANEDFAPGFMTDLMYKDVGLALALARDVGAPAPLGRLVEQLYGAARAQGYGRQDFSAVAKLYQEGGLDQDQAAGDLPARAVSQATG
jgi:3-hydroxyisobutyrate dehydrogenase